MKAFNALNLRNHLSSAFINAFILLSIFILVPKLKSEGDCQRFILNETATAKFKVLNPRAKIIDAVWSENSQSIRAMTVLGGVLTLSIHGFVEQLQQIEAHSEELINHPRVLLGPSFVLSFDDTGILIGDIKASEKTIKFERVPTVIPPIKNFSINRIYLDPTGTRLVAEGSVFGETPIILVYKLNARLKKADLVAKIDFNPESLFENEFKTANVDPKFRIGWFQRKNTISSSLNTFHISGVTNMEEKREAPANQIPNIIRGLTIQLSDPDAKEAKLEHSSVFTISAKDPTEADGYYTQHQLSPSGQYLLINYQRYDNVDYRIDFTNDVEVVDLHKAESGRKALMTPENEVYMGFVEGSDDWLVYMRMKHEDHSELGLSRPRHESGTHLVIRDLKNNLGILHEIKIPDNEAFAFPEKLQDTFDGHFHDQPFALKKKFPFGITCSKQNLFKFSVSPDKRKLMVLRDDTRFGQSDCPEQNNLWLKIYEIKALSYY
ncbi:MAG: hypothetical protein KA116_11450 [Proteobacteria bacterium]|nr:hypothetical protein [Pseudomonadota bacterium]